MDRVEGNRYRMYGLAVASPVPLWGRSEVDDADAPDVTVHWGRTGFAVPAPGGEAEPVVEHGPDWIRLGWRELGVMTIRGGREIVLETGPHAEPALARHLVTGIGLGLALHQRGVLTLHGSAVAIGGNAVAVVGGKGSGKSTLAAALIARGHALLSDDVVALDRPAGERPTVRPGPSSLNLWPDAAAATGHDPSGLERVWSRSPKRVGRLPGAASPGPTPLRAVVVRSPERGKRLTLEPLEPLDAVTRLIGHSHALRWVDESARLPWHLQECARVLDHVPVLELNRGETLDDLMGVLPDLERAASGALAPRRRRPGPTPYTSTPSTQASGRG